VLSYVIADKQTHCQGGKYGDEVGEEVDLEVECQSIVPARVSYGQAHKVLRNLNLIGGCPSGTSAAAG
jgi:hypothetical protein